MKKCAYCGVDLNQGNKTKEHIIPGGLLSLFPEQTLTFTHDKKVFRDNNGLVIRDVCNKCNNGFLSVLDSYGVELIKENFMNEFEPDESFDITFDFLKLSRWLIKIAFNHERVKGERDTWFEDNIEYIKGESNICERFSIFGGIYVDVNPIGEKNAVYLPLSIGDNLMFYENGLVPQIINKYKDHQEDECMKFNQIHKSYCFRFASAKFILIIWDSDVDIMEINNVESVIEQLFPYKIIKDSKVSLERVNDGVTGMYANLIIGNVGIDIMDSIIRKMIPDISKAQKYFLKLQSKDKAWGKMVEKMFVEDYNSRRNS